MTKIAGDEVAVVLQNFQRLRDALGGVRHDRGTCEFKIPAGGRRKYLLDGGLGENLHCNGVGVLVEGVLEARFVVSEIALA